MFLDGQARAGHFGNFHFPIHDSCVESLPAGTIHWDDETAEKHGVIKNEHCEPHNPHQ